MGEATHDLRVLHVTQGFPPEFIGGTELYCAALVEALRDRGHACFVLAGSNEQVAGPAALVTTDEGGICVTRCKSAFSPVWREQQIDPYNPETELLIRKHLVTLRPDVVHVHHWLRLTDNIVGLAAEAGIPAVVTLHDLWASCARLHRQHRLGHFCQEPPSASLCVGCVERLPEQDDVEVRRAIDLRQEQIAGELALARSVLVPSETHRQFLGRMMSIPVEGLRVLPHGSVGHLRPRADDEEHGFPGRPLRLGYWGYLVHHKGVHLLLEAAKRLEDPSAVEIFLAGLAPDTRYLKHLEELAEGLRVTFSGEYLPTDLTRFDVDVAVFPSLAYESYGFVLDEAFQLGVPVIVSDRGALAGRAGAAGLVFPAGDANGLALRIQEISNTPGLLKRMREASRSTRLPSMSSHAEALEGLYREAMRAPFPTSIPGPVTAPRRLSHLHATLAARDQAILDVKGDLRDHGVTLDRQQALIVEHENEIRRQERELQSQGAEIRWKDTQLSLSDKRFQEETARANALEAWVHRVANSVGWRVLQRFYFVREHLVAPPGSRRGRLYDLLKRAGVIYADSGFAGVARKARKRLSGAAAPNPYELWLSRHRLTPEQTQRLRAEVETLVFQPLISILMPVYNTDATCLRRALESIQSQIYPHWELCICDDGSTMGHVRQILESFSQRDERIKVLFSPSNRGVSAASNRALTLTRGEYIALVDHDDELMPHALSEIVKALNVRRSAVLYSDEAIIDAAGQATFIYFRPEFSPEYLTSHQYIVHMIVVRKDLLERIGGWDEEFPVSQDYDLLLRLMDATTDFARVPQVLYLWRHHDRRHSLLTKDMVADYGKRALTKHLARTAVTGDVVDTPFFNVFRIRRHVSADKVSIIIPTKNKVELLQACIDSIEQKSSYRNYELIIVDNNSEDPATLRYLDGLPYRVIRYAQPFNYSAINNLAAANASGEHFVFLNNDTEVITNDWLEVLLEQSQRKEVGVVGAKLLFGNGQVQHGGVVLGLGGQLADHAFRFADRGDAGYLSSLVSTRNYSAVTGACMMMRAEVFRELRGFDEEIQVVYSDVDLCLRVWEEGYRVVWTPHALLYHHEARTRKELTPQADVTTFMRKWAHLVTQTDRFYHPDLSLQRFDFSLDA